MNRYIVRCAYYNGDYMVAYRDVEINSLNPMDAVAIAASVSPGSFSQDVIETNGKRHAG